ncbi:uncharacterized protein LOC129741757 [Uranotaenia lowii]|uniref:uncharacterized protein LOC129741757 n=1 Tax=Uranotaenia lowii TaxID=190385 RepID=UPI00247A7D06|nr:uncharacterized protein LOC129741757 [Uranotaenia lowii]
MNTDENVKLEDAVQVQTVSAPRLNPPNMTASNIESYFLSLEFWFAASGIGASHDTKKYNIVMAQVPVEKLTELRTIIEGVPVSEKYPYIKSKLIEHFADSQQRRLHRVLAEMPLGDKKPSQLFNEMQRVAGTSLGDAVLIDLWTSRLPAHAQPAVIASKGAASEKTAIADAIVDSMGLRSISAIENSVVQKPAISVEQSLVECIGILQKEIAGLSRKLEQSWPANSEFRGRNRSNSRGRSVSSRRSNEEEGQCWYHRTFGREATRCRKPCSFGRSSSPAHRNQQ